MRALAYFISVMRACVCLQMANAYRTRGGGGGEVGVRGRGGCGGDDGRGVGGFTTSVIQ